VLVRQIEGWGAYTYRWNESGSDADRLTAPRNDVIDVGGTPQTWTFPGADQCLRCHNANAGGALAVRTDQLNRDFDYPARRDNQLRAWNHIGLFDRDIGDAAGYDAVPDPSDASVAVAARARSYLHENCSICHRPGGPTPLDLDLLRNTPESEMNVIDVIPTETPVGLPNERRVAPGTRTSSTLWERLRRRDAFRMPPAGSNLADDAAVDLIGEWIDTR
jgi:mono/diheme cytochrome c family protein